MNVVFALLFFAVAASPAELRFAIAGDPKTFDPLHAEESHSEMVRYLTSGVLVRVDRVSGELKPELAESWAVKDGGRSISFHLRAGLRFSDGSPLSAEDVARTLRRALDAKEGSPVGDTFRTSGAAPDIQVSGPRDIAIRYKTPKPGLDRLFDSLGVAPPRLAELPASAGPFFVADYKRGVSVLLRRNPNYWQRDAAGHALPYLDSVRLDIQSNHDIELNRFLRNEINVIDKLSPENFNRVMREKPGAAKSVGPSLDAEFFWFNQAPGRGAPEWKRKWFVSTAFRRAVSGAINREDLGRIAYLGRAHPAAGPISPANRFWYNAALRPRAADPEGALKALAAEGFRLRDGALTDRDGHAVEFSLITNAGNRPRERMAALVQSDLKKIGIRVTIATLEFGSLIERITSSLNYEAALLGLNNTDEDPLEQMNVFLSSGREHAWWPQQKTPATPWEARIDELVLRQAGESSREKRKAAIDEVQRIVADEEPIIYLVNPDALCAAAPSVKGIRPAVSSPHVLWNIEWLRVE